MSGGGQQPTQSTTTQISPQAQQLFNLAYPGIANFAASPPPTRYPSSTVAGFDPAQVQAQESALQVAPQQQQIASWATNLAQSVPNMLSWDVGSAGVPYTRTPLETSSNIFSDPGIWNPDYNPGMEASIAAAQRPIYQNLTEQVLPAIRQTAISTGPFGGSRQEIAEGIASSRAGQTAADEAAKIVQALYSTNLSAANQRYLGNLGALNQRYGIDVGAETAFRGQDIGAEQGRYGQNLDAIYRTLGLTPSLQGAWSAAPATLGAVGDVRQQMSQAQLNDLVNAYYYNQYAPYLQSRDILGLIPSIPGATNVSTANVPQASPWTQALGGAATGASIGSLVPIPGSSLAGAGIGAALPFLFR